MRIMHRLNGDEPLWLIDEVVVPDLIPEGKERVGNIDMWRNLGGWTLEIVVRDKVMRVEDLCLPDGDHTP